MSSVSSAMLGVYEYRDNRSNKFWKVSLNLSTGFYDTEWGKNGFPAQGKKKGLDDREAYQKIHEKINKGYQKTDGAHVALQQQHQLKKMVSTNQKNREKEAKKAGLPTASASALSPQGRLKFKTL